MKGFILICLAAALAACDHVSPSRLGYETLQQHECMVRTGVNCPAEVDGYDAYRTARKAETGR